MATREEWLEQKQRTIGASEAAAALGISPFKTPYQLWAEKCGLIERPDLSANEAVEFGCRLERPIAEAYADRTGRVVSMWPQYQSVVHPEHPWMSCTPDAIQYHEDGRRGLLQIKTTSAWNAAEWQEGPPLHYQVQCQHELAVTGYEWTTLVVLIGGQRLRYYDIDRNQHFIDAMIPQLQSFWDRVETRQPPEVDGSYVTAKVLAKLHPADSGDAVELSDDALVWDEELAALKQEIKTAEERKTLLENRIKAALGDATFGILPNGGRYSWKTQVRKAYEVAESTTRVLRRLK